MKSAGIHFLNYQSFILTQPFSFLNELTGPILTFVGLPLSKWSFVLQVKLAINTGNGIKNTHMGMYFYKNLNDQNSAINVDSLPIQK